MQNIFIEEKDDAPKVILDADKKIIEFEGECYPENTFEFFEPIMMWLGEYFKEARGDTTINFKLTYFNSATTQVLFDIFDILEENREMPLAVNWFYDVENADALLDYEEFNAEFETLSIQAVVSEKK